MLDNQCIHDTGLNEENSHLHLLDTISPDVENEAVLIENSIIGGSNYDSLIVRTVAFPVQVAYWTKRSWPPAEIVSHVKFDQWSGDMAVGSCGLVAIHA